MHALTHLKRLIACKLKYNDDSDDDYDDDVMMTVTTSIEMFVIMTTFLAQLTS